MRIAAIVQARMRSTRLPGKVMRPIAGRPLLWHVMHRLRKSRLIQEIVLATTTDPADDRLAEWAQANGVPCVRGPEDDVLGRFALAAEACRPDVIVRVNADSPLIDAAVIDAMVRALIRANADYVVPKGPVAHDGVDPMSRRALNLMLAEAREDPVAREHVTGWLKLNPHRIKVVEAEIDPAYAFEGARLSVDTPADAAFVEAVYERLNAQAGEASLSDLLALMRRDPSLARLNAHVAQKDARAVSGTVVVRCDGGRALGLGHVKRCLSLARALQDRKGLGVVFAMIGDDAAAASVAGAGFMVERKPEGESERDWIGAVAARFEAKALVLDVRTDLSAADVRRLRALVPTIAAIDDISERREAAHLVALPPVPQTRRLAWSGETDLLIGWNWTILGGEPWRAPRPLLSDRARPRVLVSMGGSDPGGLTLTALRAVSALGAAVQPVVAIGPAVAEPEALAQAIRDADTTAEIHLAPDGLMGLAAECDVALISYGVSALECAHVGVPAIYLALTPDHAASAQACHDAGFGTTLGLARETSEAAIAEALDRLLSDPTGRRAMAAAGRLGIDGRGADRLAGEIAARIARPARAAA